MKAKYQKYYDALKGKDFSTPAGQYSSVLSEASTKLGTSETLINESTWYEKGLEIIKGSVVPSLKSQGTQLESGISALTQVAGKVTDLVNQLSVLESLEETLANLGSKWSYVEGGTRTLSEVNSHNTQIDETTTKITEQEASIDGTIAAINGISFNFTSAKATFTGHITDLKEVIEEEKEKNKSGVLSYTVGDLEEPGTSARLLGKRATLLEIDCDGVNLGQDGSIVIKKGQTVHLKVKVPDEIENVTTLKRTSVGGTLRSESSPGWSGYVSQSNDPQVNKNDKSTYADQREYDWYITGTNVGDITVSQTALFSIPGAKLGSYKGMARVHVKIVD